MQCQACGGQNSPNAHYCTFCGRPLGAQESVTAPTPSLGDSGQTAPPVEAPVPGYPAPAAPPYTCVVCGTVLGPMQSVCPRCHTPRGMAVDPNAAVPGAYVPIGAPGGTPKSAAWATTYEPNTSGTGEAPPPEIARGFNWGAFWLPSFWGIAHKAWPTLIIWVLWVASSAVGLVASLAGGPAADDPTHMHTGAVMPSPLTWVLLVAGWVVSFWFGKQGNGWAWRNRHFASEAEYRYVQQQWGLWAKICFGLSIVQYIFLALFYALAASITKSMGAPPTP